MELIADIFDSEAQTPPLPIEPDPQTALYFISPGPAILFFCLAIATLFFCRTLRGLCKAYDSLDGESILLYVCLTVCLFVNSDNITHVLPCPPHPTAFSFSVLRAPWLAVELDHVSGVENLDFAQGEMILLPSMTGVYLIYGKAPARQ